MPTKTTFLEIPFETEVLKHLETLSKAPGTTKQQVIRTLVLKGLNADNQWIEALDSQGYEVVDCLLYTSPSPRDS